MARKNAIISVETGDNGELIFTVGEAGCFTFDANSASDEIRTKAMLHGFRQKIADGAAFPKEANATEKDKLEAMKAIAIRLANGDWKASRGEGATVQTGIVLRAWLEFVETSAKAKKAKFDREAATDLFKAKGWATIRKIDAVKDIIERMKAEAGDVSAVNADDLLGELGI